MRYLEACADMGEKRYEDALAKLEQLDSDYGARRNALTLRGEALQRLQRWDESRAAFKEALALDAEAPGPLLGMARAALAARDFQSAIDHARQSLGLLYFQPKGHYIPAMSVSYADLVHRPDEALPPLAAFLGVPERLEAMRAVIDPSLHRARGGAELVADPA